MKDKCQNPGLFPPALRITSMYQNDFSMKINWRGLRRRRGLVHTRGVKGFGPKPKLNTHLLRQILKKLCRVLWRKRLSWTVVQSVSLLLVFFLWHSSTNSRTKAGIYFPYIFTFCARQRMKLSVLDDLYSPGSCSRLVFLLVSISLHFRFFHPYFHFINLWDCCSFQF